MSKNNSNFLKIVTNLWQDCKYPFIIFSVSRFIIFCTVYITNKYNLGEATFFNWDAQQYISIVSNGYIFHGSYTDAGSYIAFFPLYPITVKLFSFLIPLNIINVALIASFVFGLASALVLYKIAKSWKGEDVGMNAVFLFSFFPMSVFLTAPYSESLLSLLVLSSFWLFERKKLTISAITISLSLVTNIPGFVLIPIFIYELYKNKKSIIYSLSHLTIIMIPFTVFMYFQYVKYGTPFAFLLAHKINWHNEATFPWNGFKFLLSYSNSDIFYKIEFIFLLIMLITLILAKSHINKKLLFFGWGIILLSLSQSFILALPRLMIPPIPFYLFWGFMLTRHFLSRQLVFITFGSWMVFNTILFSLHRYIF